MAEDKDTTSSEVKGSDDEGNPLAPDRLAEMAVAMKTEGLTAQTTAESAADSSTASDHVTESTAEEEAIEQQAPVDAETIARAVSSQDVNIDTLLKVPVSLAIEVGRTQIILSDLLDTQEGSVLELERLLEEPLDILVNGALIARGVIVLANDRFGLQITDIISLEDRARSL